MKTVETSLVSEIYKRLEPFMPKCQAPEWEATNQARWLLMEMLELPDALNALRGFVDLIKYLEITQRKVKRLTITSDPGMVSILKLTGDEVERKRNVYKEITFSFAFLKNNNLLVDVDLTIIKCNSQGYIYHKLYIEVSNTHGRYKYQVKVVGDSKNEYTKLNGDMGYIQSEIETDLRLSDAPGIEDLNTVVELLSI